MLQVSPSNGPDVGGTQVTLRGQHYLQSSLLKCKFGRVAAAAVYVSDTYMNCTTPAHPAGLAQVQVSTNGVDYHSGGQTFLFQSEVRLYAATPTVAVTGGSVYVIVVGTHLLPSSTCMVGGQLSEYSSWISSSEVLCKLPSLAPGNYVVRITNNLQDFSMSTVAYSVAEAFVVTALHPQMGPAGGGATVIVRGVDFSTAQWTCRFGLDEVVAAVQLNSTALSCVAPQMSPQNVTIEVSHNNQQYTASGKIFEYQRGLTLISATPSHGPSSGGTLIVLQGHFFSLRAASLGLPRCRFGSEVTAAAVIDEHTMQCVTPEHHPGVATVEASNNGQDFETSLVRFDFSGWTVSSVSPTVVVESGGTTLAISGAQFPRAAVLSCVFGANQNTPARVVSSARLLCVSPPSGRGLVQLRVLGSGQAEGEYKGLEVVVTNTPEVFKVDPARAREGGGTRLIVVGSQFSQSAASLGYLRCRFGQSVVPATFVNTSAVMCTSPPLASLTETISSAGSVHVEVSHNAADFSSSEVVFVYRAEVYVHSLLPVGGATAGGSLVQVRGASFEAGGLLCSFGGSPVAATLVSSELVRCHAPARAQVGAVAVEVSTNNGWDFSRSGVTFLYQAGAAVIALTPSNGPTQGRTLVSVSGMHFLPSLQLRCRFGVSEVAAVFVSTSMANCTAPAASAGVVSVEVSTNGIDFTNSSVAYLYQEKVQVLALVPGLGSTQGGANVSVIGTNFLQDSLCRFGEHQALHVLWVSPFELVCTAPPQVAGQYAVEVSANVQDWTDSRVEFAYHKAVRVHAVSPVLGPEYGGTLVEVAGDGFVSSAHLVCRFDEGSLPVTAQWVNASAVRCRTPAHAAGNVSVQVSGNNQQFSGEVVLFEYQLPMVVGSVRPVEGPLGGGTLVVVQGQHFSYRSAVLGAMYCVFDSTWRPAQLTSGTSLQCVSPPQSAGTVSLAVSSNGADLSLSLLSFKYAATHLYDVRPPLGPAAGGTVLTLSGKNLDHRMQCLFGVIRTDTTWLSTATALCSSPPHTVGTVQLTLGTPSLSELWTWSGGFAYLSEAVVYYTRPSAGPEGGGTRLIVVGSQFSQSAASLGYLRCRFGQSVVPATFVNTSAVMCTSPPLASLTETISSAGSVHVEVSHNAADFSSSEVVFVYRAEVYVHSLLPVGGATAGGSLVQVRGASFEAGGLLCSFGGSPVAATLVSSELVRCHAPARAQVGAVAVEVSTNNGWDFSRSGVTFLYQAGAAVIALTPSNGPTQGRTLVSVSGMHFLPSLQLRCRFGVSEVAAVFVSTSMANCTAPAASAGVVSVEVSTNGIDFTNSSVAYLYQEKVQVLALVPGLGSTQGGANVSVIGTNFLQDSLCRFGEHQALHVLWVSPFELVCTAPPQVAGQYAVEVSANVQDWTDSRVEFAYHKAVRVHAVSPVLGPEYGGTLVEVAGDGFVSSAHLVCRFDEGSLPVTAQWVNASAVRCRTPAHAAGNVSVKVSGNNQQFSGEVVLFEYQLPMVVGSVRPVEGPVGGGTLVVVQGQHFSYRSAALGLLACRFGDTIVPAILSSPNQLRCISPPGSSCSSVPLELTANGRDLTTLSRVTFAYVQYQIDSIKPASGPAGGGTVVEVTGSRLGSAPGMACYFGAAISNVAIINATRLLCISPPHSVGPVELLLGPAECTARPYTMVFQFHEEVLVYALLTTSGPVLGGAYVTLRGAHFSSTHDMLCRFDLTASPATFVNETSIACISPSHAPASVPVEVSLNGRDFSASGIRFEYSLLSLYRVQPTLGSVRGGTLVSVWAHGVQCPMKDLFCVFGEVQSSARCVSTARIWCSALRLHTGRQR